MPANIRSPAPSDALHRPHATSALRVSAFSVAWTVVSSSLAIALGVRSDTAVLVAFGAIGVVDAVGSLALVYHFAHSLRHDQFSEKLEALAHRVVLTGLFLVGCAAVLGGLVRLMIAERSGGSNAALAFAAVSFVALIVFSRQKQRVARRISSNALLSDGHLSAVGAMQAGVALAGIAISRWLGWYWADAAATILIGGVAIWLAVSTWRAEHARPGTPARPSN